MNILLVSASPRKESRTDVLARAVLEGCIESGAHCRRVRLRDLRIGFCLHCEACHARILRCSLKDDVMSLAEDMLAADGIVFATPNYINQVTASLKAVFDRHSHFIHCKRLLGKYTAAVVTSGSGYDLPVLRYLKYYSIICGAQYSGGISCCADEVRTSSDAARALGRKLAADIARTRVYPGQQRRIEKGIDYFARVIRARRKDWKEEYAYWKKKGWL